MMSSRYTFEILQLFNFSGTTCAILFAREAQDMYNSGMITHESCSIRALEGKLSARRGNAGVVEMLVFKKDALAHLLTEWLSKLDIRPDVKNKIRQVCGSIACFRAHCGWPAKQVSRAWQAGWTRAEETVLDFIEACLINL